GGGPTRDHPGQEGDCLLAGTGYGEPFNLAPGRRYRRSAV
ncbi:MAG: hypothetical protein AVDCRST_MAG88-1145, partial [uncultured Thermomicrobiales bacterium]